MTVIVNGQPTQVIPDIPLPDSAADYRRSIVESLRSTHPLRKALMERGSLESDAELEKAFAPCVDAGRFNARHPDAKITICDLIEVVSSLPGKT